MFQKMCPSLLVVPTCSGPLQTIVPFYANLFLCNVAYPECDVYDGGRRPRHACQLIVGAVQLQVTLTKFCCVARQLHSGDSVAVAILLSPSVPGAVFSASSSTAKALT